MMQDALPTYRRFRPLAFDDDSDGVGESHWVMWGVP